MIHNDGYFNGPRNTRIYHQHWLPGNTPEPKAVILIVHGLGEHSGRYMNVINQVVPIGYAVYALDHIGHGKSDGTRAFIEHFSDFTETLTQFHAMIMRSHPDKPIFLLGHSLGGLIASYYLLDNQDKFKGAVISAPAVKVADNITPATILISNILSKIAPHTKVIALDATGVSRDPAVVDAYINDPLNFHGKFPARMGAEMLTAMQRVTAEADTISLPILIVQGSADKMIDPGGAPMLYEKSSSSDKTLKVYDGYYHEIFNELETDRKIVLNDVSTWLDTHLN